MTSIPVAASRRARCFFTGFFPLVVLASVGWFAPVVSSAVRAETAVTEADETLYRSAIEKARAGETTPALAVLRSLIDLYPQRQDIRGDFAVVLGWAGEFAAALALRGRIDPASAPAYVTVSRPGATTPIYR